MPCYFIVLFFTLQMLWVTMLDLSKYLTIWDHLKISRTAFCFIKWYIVCFCRIILYKYCVSTVYHKRALSCISFVRCSSKCRSYFWFSDCPLLKKSQSSDASPIHILMTHQTSTTRHVYCVILWLYLINIFMRLNISLLG